MSAQRISVLDGWRGVAILAVLFGHFVPGFGVGSAYNAGRAGVELFFSLSGVLIGQILFVDRLNLIDFAVRRFSRVVPSMWVFIAVVAPFTAISASSLIQDVFGFANVANNPVSMGHLWSVAAELQGYVCLGFLCWIGRTYSLRMTSVMTIVIAMAWVCIFSAAWRGTDDYYSTYWRFPYRFTAMFAAAILVSQPHLKAFCTRYCLYAIAMGLTLQFNVVPDCVKYTLGSLSLAVGCVGMTGEVLPRVLVQVLSARALVLFGSASYSIYLWQQIFYAWHGAPWYARLAVAIGCGFAADFIWDRRLNRWTRAGLQRCVTRFFPGRLKAPAAGSPPTHPRA